MGLGKSLVIGWHHGSLADVCSVFDGMLLHSGVFYIPLPPEEPMRRTVMTNARELIRDLLFSEVVAHNSLEH
jgi:hypothetical protein